MVMSTTADDDSTQKDFMRKVVALMHVLCEECIGTAAKFCEACGRSNVAAADMILALKYESHEFWNKDIDERFFQNLQDEQEHTYETDDDSESGEEGDSDSEENEEESGNICETRTVENEEEGGNIRETRTVDDDEKDEVYHTQFKQGDLVFYRRVLEIENEWNDWKPSDPIKMLLKRAIEDTCTKFST